MLLELLQYIINNPEPSQKLLEQLRLSKLVSSNFIEGLVF
jgi:hypothetical protein